jgi:hypothetical protein
MSFTHRVSNHLGLWPRPASRKETDAANRFECRRRELPKPFPVHAAVGEAVSGRGRLGDHHRNRLGNCNRPKGMSSSRPVADPLSIAAMTNLFGFEER